MAGKRLKFGIIAGHDTDSSEVRKALKSLGLDDAEAAKRPRPTTGLPLPSLTRLIEANLVVVLVNKEFSPHTAFEIGSVLASGKALVVGLALQPAVDVPLYLSHITWLRASRSYPRGLREALAPYVKAAREHGAHGGSLIPPRKRKALPPAELKVARTGDGVLRPIGRVADALLSSLHEPHGPHANLYGPFVRQGEPWAEESRVDLGSPVVLAVSRAFQAAGVDQQVVSSHGQWDIVLWASALEGIVANPLPVEIKSGRANHEILSVVESRRRESNAPHALLLVDVELDEWRRRYPRVLVAKTDEFIEALRNRALDEVLRDMVRQAGGE
jgi:hypothetical protein